MRISISDLSKILGNSYTHRFIWAIGLFAILFITGVAGYILIESYTLIEAVYMTVITISTVGFTEVKPLTDAGRIFTSILIILNIGILAYAVSVTTSFILEGELQDIFKLYKVNKDINNLKDHVVVCGYGRHGKKVVEELRSGKHPFVVIESDEHLLSHLKDEDNILFVEGDATEEESIVEAGIERAKSLITTLPKDADNLFVVLTARQFNKDLNIISRASDESSHRKLIRTGADHVILPEHIGGAHMANLVTKPDLIEFISLISGEKGVNIYFGEFGVSDVNEHFQGKTIIELDIRKKTGAHIIGMRKSDGSYIINPDPETKITSADKLILLGTEYQIGKFREYLGK